MKHDPYSLTELIRNDDFIAWVRQPDQENEARWRRFLELNPEKKQTVESARRYVILLGEDTGKSQPTPEQSNRMWKAVEKHLHKEEEPESEAAAAGTIPVPGGMASGWRWARMAASAALMLGFTSFSYWYYVNQSGRRQEVTVHEGKWQPQSLIEKINDTGKPMMVLLPDGSSVVLHPGGKLQYAAQANAGTREVTLSGSAFFEIVKDPGKPFLVYSFGLVTKVLGTSFLVDAKEDSKEVKVEVKTGKVSVFSLQEDQGTKQQANSPELEGIILNPDQKIAFSRADGKFSKPAEAAGSSLDEGDIFKQSFVFDETPISEVFQTLEKAYNVKIIYNAALMGDCPMNATLAGQPIYEKLSVICSALEAEFEIQGNLVRITGSGCK